MNQESFNLLYDLPKPLPKEELKELFLQYKKGNYSVRETIILHNLRLVLYVVYKYIRNKNDLEEFFSIGLIGLIKAVDTYDISKNVEFSSYANCCIQNEFHMFFRKNQKNIKEAISLDAPLLDGASDASLSDFLIDFDSDTTEIYEKKETIQELLKIVNQLPDKEKEIIYLHFGLYGNKEYNQREIAKKLNISYSYVSKIIKTVLCKLKKKMNFLANEKNVFNRNSKHVKKYTM